MVGTRQGTNTSGKDKKSVKETSLEDKTIVNRHCMKMKGVVIRGNADGPTLCPPTIEPRKEIR